MKARDGLLIWSLGVAFVLLVGCSPGRHSAHRLPQLFSPKSAPKSDKKASLCRGRLVLTGGRRSCRPKARKPQPRSASSLSVWRQAKAPVVRLKGAFTVLTFNVNYGGHIGRAIQAIRRSNADVVALQETTPAWPQQVRRALGKRYPARLFYASPGAGGMGFLSRFPILSHQRLKPRHGGWFDAWLLVVKTPAGKVRFLNVHLRPPLGEDGRLSSIPRAFFATRAIRLRELQAHMAHILPLSVGRRSAACGNKAAKCCLPPLVVLGDFNEDRQGLAMRWLRKKRGMTSALQRFDRTTPTWTWPTRWWTFRWRLDHVMLSPQLHPLAASVLPAAGSDHFPVLTKIALR